MQIYSLQIRPLYKESKHRISMEKLEPIIQILERIIASGFVKNGFPLSCIVVARVGAGKTVSVKKYIKNKNILGLSDITPYGLTKLLGEIKLNNVKHIIIFDMVEPMSRSRSCVNNLIGFLNSLIEEGIFRISTGFIEVKEPIKLGLITTTTPSELLDKRRGWLAIGFISRMLPISYEYSKIDVIQILESIAKSEIADVDYVTLKKKEKNIKTNPEIEKELIPYSQAIDKLDTALPFRRLKQLKVLLMANALLDNRNEVTLEDLNWFKGIAKHINLDFNVL